MEIILHVLQVFLAVGLIGVVLLQRSEGGGLGIGSSGGAGSFMSVRGTANFLTRVTAILAALFMITCLALALLAKPNGAPKSIFDVPAPAANPAPPLPPTGEKPDAGATANPPPAEAPAPLTEAPINQAPAATMPAATVAPPPAPTAQPAAAAKPKKAPQTGAARTPGQ